MAVHPLAPRWSAEYRAACAGLFVISAATLMYEILLTRIFSVTLWYHFAFLAVAAALLGMTAGAVLVQVRPRTFTPAATPGLLALTALAFALGVPATFVAHLAIRSVPVLTVAGLLSIVLTYAVIAIPFVFSGIAVCLALTKLGGRVGGVYAADLAGAGLGCVAAVGVLEFTDAPAAVFVTAAVGALAAALFAVGARRPLVLAGALGVTVLSGLVAAAGPSWIRLTWIKGAAEAGPTLYERWNSYSRIRVTGDPAAESAPFAWGLSPSYPSDRRVSQLVLSIDAVADTPLTRFDGDFAAVDHLRYDATSFAHHLRRKARVLVVGAGGGRDVLAALAFGAREVVAVELNEAILDAVNGHFGAYTGHLDRQPGVRFVNDEARSFVARARRRFDLVQLSFIDTFAASAAGAYVLTEHSLYTTEAWRSFLDHLTPGGLLTCSRWYFHRFPAEIQRMVALASASLREAGVRRPREHLLLVRSRTGADPRYREAIGVGTLLVAREPFSSDDLTAARTAAARLRFDIVLDPVAASDPTLEALADAETFAGAVAASPLDISPPTDDRPFFFHTVPLGRALRFSTIDQGNVGFNTTAVVVLVGALLVAAGASVACFVLPLLGRRRPTARARDGLFFAAIGLGYILIEIAQLQRLSVFLGHPTYGLVVALFALLLASGLGSFTVAGRLDGPPVDGGRAAGARAPGLRPLFAVPLVLIVFGLLTPWAITHLRGLGTPARIVLAVVLLSPPGFVMGMAFPRGLQLATRHAPASAPWLWAINGTTSVLGSIGAVLMSISGGLSVTFSLGVAAYVVAAGVGVWMTGGSSAIAGGGEGEAQGRTPLESPTERPLPTAR